MVGLHHLEGPGHHRPVRRALHLDDAAVRGGRDDPIRGTGKPVDHRVQQRLHPDVAVGSAEEHRHEHAGHGQAAQSSDQQVVVHVSVGDQHLQHGVVVQRHVVQQTSASRLDLHAAIGGHGPHHHLLSVVAHEGQLATAHHVDHPAMVGLEAHGKLHGDGLQPETTAELLHHRQRVGTPSVALVHEGQEGHGVALHLAHDGPGLGLHAGDSVQHQHRPVQGRHGPFHLDREVDVSGGVHDVQLRVAPDRGRGRSTDGDASVPLLGVMVEGRRSRTAGLAQGVDAARVEQDALGERGLSCVDVGSDAEGAKGVKGRHDVLLGQRARRKCRPEAWEASGRGSADARHPVSETERAGTHALRCGGGRSRAPRHRSQRRRQSAPVSEAGTHHTCRNGKPPSCTGMG